MRFRQNPYGKFTPEQQVMGDKAESLGYTWDRVKYPTPAWGDLYDLAYDEPLFNIPGKVWLRELKLWAADCIERALPVWENWAENIIELEGQVYTARAAVESVRLFYQGKISLGEMDRASKVAYGAYMTSFGYIRPPYIDDIVFSASLIASSRTEGQVGISNIAYTISRYNNPAQVYDDDLYVAERAWQQQALAKRLDPLAPWSLR